MAVVGRAYVLSPVWLENYVGEREFFKNFLENDQTLSY